MPPLNLCHVSYNEIPSVVAAVISKIECQNVNTFSKFKSVSDNDIDQFVAEQENAATKKRNNGTY